MASPKASRNCSNLNNNPTIPPGPRPIIVTGPTGVGKSAFSVELAEKIGGEIIGADAFQIYSGLPILTAQPGPELTRRVPHHLIGALGLHESCNAARFAKMARTFIQEIRSRGKIPILAGGTGLYLKALTHGLADLPPTDPGLRGKISAMEPRVALARLGEADGAALGQIDARNPARVRRALEIVLSTGKPLAASREAWKSEGSGFRGILLGRDREEIWKRIEGNVDAMFRGGVLEEVRRAAEAGPGASRAIGFREIQELLAGRITASQCRNAMVTATRRYAKRQLTWCRHQFNFPLIHLSATNLPGLPIKSAVHLLGLPDDMSA